MQENLIKYFSRSRATCRIGTHLILFLASTLSSAMVAAALPPPVERALKQARIPSNAVSLYIREVGRERPLMEHRPALAMNPASVMKLVTTIVALDALTPAYRWNTDFLTSAPMENGVLLGPLVIRGSGDPKFTWEHLQSAVIALREQGIKEIRGEIQLDRTRFAPATYDAAAFDGQPLRPYNATPDALLYNFSALGFKFTTSQAGDVVLSTEGPLPDGLTIVNKLRAVKGSCGDWRTKLNAEFDGTSGAPRATFSGVYPTECGERSWYVNFLNHNDFLIGSFARLWRDAGGVWSAPARSVVATPFTTPKNARLLYRHVSPPLTTMVTDINKFSNNVMARQLLLSFDAQVNDSPGKATRAAYTVNEWVKLRGFETPDLVIENGSGLSRKERISAKSLTRFLEYGLTAPFAADFVQSLPIAATDGTLAHRFTHGATAGNAFLKTGTLNGVKSLAGYLQLPNNRRFIFVGIVNHPNIDTAGDVLDGAVDWVFQNVK